MFRLDPGWLFLMAGSVLIAATVLIPAADDLTEAQWHRERALSVERFRANRLENYSVFMDAVAREDRTLIESLAATQLNLAPADKRPMLDLAAGLSLRPSSASVFPALEPEFRPASPPKLPQTLLHTWATDDHKRLWLIVVGAVCMLVGMLPASVRR